MVKKIALASGKYPGNYALVDDEDLNYLSLYTWQLLKSPIKGRDLFYATSKHYGLMHRVIAFVGMEIDITKKDVIDHKNGNGLDNRRCNLRVVTRRQNQQNKHVKTSSKYPGVCFSKNGWVSQIEINGVATYLGCFKTEKEAFKVYKDAVHELTGELLVCELDNAHGIEGK